ncbi:hypothetical protein [Actinacidiphila oryziradicis]|uniref:Uncharacterized protein n=1 Tax=Actinacidiphila oryziradicis TaxID=2571141 RepID=A0A4U0RHG3_9ACTN|nr:hypothetical protein [Actinacidiphila oryziradicis]TJZ95063.1 hypothetical protein FCI23_52600 [Actinacidiphila oryziradicis]
MTEASQELFSKLFEKEIKQAVANAVHEKLQLSREDLSRMTAEQIVQARKAGVLDDLLFGRN